jgi:hypothetical protein
MSRLDFDPDLERLGDALRASTTIDLAREHQATPADRRAPGRARLPRQRLLAGGTLALAGVGAALVLALSGSAASPAFAVTRSNDGSVLVKLNQDSALPQVNRRLMAMGTGEQIAIYMAPGAAAVSGPVTCTPAPGVAGPAVKVLNGGDGTYVVPTGNTGAGTWHLARCTTTGDTGSGNTGNTGAG